MAFTNGTHGPTGHQTDSDLDALYAWHMPQPAPQALPEAPASVNVRVQVGGREVQWTLRDSDEARLAQRLEELLARYPLPQPAPQVTSQGAGWCSKHQVAMQEHTNDKGRWFSHYVDGRHCKGR